jgi:hypothetical protein
MNCGAQNLLLVTHDKDWDAEVLWRKRERYWPEATAQMVRWSLQCAGWVGMTDYLEYLAARVGHGCGSAGQNLCRGPMTVSLLHKHAHRQNVTSIHKARLPATGISCTSFKAVSLQDPSSHRVESLSLCP